MNKTVIAEVQPMSGFETFCQRGNVGFLNYRQDRGYYKRFEDIKILKILA